MRIGAHRAFAGAFEVCGALNQSDSPVRWTIKDYMGDINTTCQVTIGGRPSPLPAWLIEAVAALPPMNAVPLSLKTFATYSHPPSRYWASPELIVGKALRDLLVLAL